MAIAVRPAPTDPQAEFEARFAEQLAKLAALRRALDEARDELADATVENLSKGTALDKVGRLDKRVADLDRQVEAAESVCDRAKAVQRVFVRQADAATLEAVQRQRSAVRAEWERTLERERALIEDLARVLAQASALEDEDAAAASLERDLRARSLGRGRVIPAVTGGAFEMIAVGHAPKALAEAIRAARAAAIP